LFRLKRWLATHPKIEAAKEAVRSSFWYADFLPHFGFLEPDVK
jgi:hypothetical protein